MTMYSTPRLTGQIGGDRQRDMLARAEQQRRAKRFRAQSRTAGQAEPPERHPGRAFRAMTRLRTVIPRPTRQIADGDATGGAQPPEA